MINPKAEPIGNRNPYKRIDLAKRLRRVITLEEVYREELMGIASEGLYEWDDTAQVWRLK